MLRLGKMTDYAMLVLTYMARSRHVGVYAARSLSDEIRVPLPTVQKVLKVLTREGLTQSVRGKRGGYSLALDPADITLLQVIETLEGPIGLTECASADGEPCDRRDGCSMSGHWPFINRAIRAALGAMSILDVSRVRDEKSPLAFMDSNYVPAEEQLLPTEG
jgi:FeS assembly SUF system regulator